jgi:hypothetical protein
VVSEVILMVLGARACADARFAVPVAKPVALSLVATLPMALAVWGVRDNPPLALAVGVVTYGATLAAFWQLLPAPVRRLVGAADGSAPSGEPTSGGPR